MHSCIAKYKAVFILRNAQASRPSACVVLCRDCFAHYVAQDAYFLTEFAKAYAAAMDKCDSIDTEEYATLQKLLTGVFMELRLHGGYAKKWGVQLHHMTQPSPATKAYTDFLRSVAEAPEVIYFATAACCVAVAMQGRVDCRMAGLDACCHLTAVCIYPQIKVPFKTNHVPPTHNRIVRSTCKPARCLCCRHQWPRCWLPWCPAQGCMHTWVASWHVPSLMYDISMLNGFTCTQERITW